MFYGIWPFDILKLSEKGMYFTNCRVISLFFPIPWAPLKAKCCATRRVISSLGSSSPALRCLPDQSRQKQTLPFLSLIKAFRFPVFPRLILMVGLGPPRVHRVRHISRFIIYWRVICGLLPAFICFYAAQIIALLGESIFFASFFVGTYRKIGKCRYCDQQLVIYSAKKTKQTSC